MREKYVQAVAHHQAGRLRQAEALYREILKADPNQADALNLLGLLAHQTGNSGQAAKLIAKAIGIDAGRPGYHVHLGQALHALGRSGEAAESYRRALGLEPLNAAALINMGICLLDVGGKTEAVAMLEKAVAAQPLLAPAHLNLGIALHRLGEETGDQELFRRAREAFGEAHRLEPENANTLANMAVAQVKSMELEKAVETCLEALKVAPKQELAQVTLGTALLHLGRFEEAVEILEITVGSHPDLTRAYVQLGKAYYRLDRIGPTIVAFERALGFRPDDLALLGTLGKLHFRAGQFDQSIAALEAFLKIDDTMGEVHSSLGQALLGARRPEEAGQAFARALELDPGDSFSKYAVSALGEGAARAGTAEYVVELFDDFAATFDEFLRGDLAYRTPEILHAAVAGVAGPDAADWTIAEVGCGTGLCGPLFRNLGGHLLGTDLSPGMIEKARERDVYDELRVEALEATLTREAAAFDLVLAADVFVYIGNLDPVFAACAGALKPGGLFAFSTEEAAEDGVAFNQTFRFSHARAYVEALAAKHGFIPRHTETAEIRTEGGAPVQGGIYVLERS